MQVGSPSFELVVPTTTWLYLLLIQRSKRALSETRYWYDTIDFSFVRLDGQGRALQEVSRGRSSKKIFQSERLVGAGRYGIVLRGENHAASCTLKCFSAEPVLLKESADPNPMWARNVLKSMAEKAEANGGGTQIRKASRMS